MHSHVGETLKLIKYHGQGREKNLDKLQESDLVITTYNTLATERAKNKSVLHDLEWYRVVLDEGRITLPQLNCLEW